MICERFQIKSFVLIDECVFICTRASILAANIYPVSPSITSSGVHTSILRSPLLAL